MKARHLFNVGDIVNARRIIKIQRGSRLNKNIYTVQCLHCMSTQDLTHDSLAHRSKGTKTTYCLHCLKHAPARDSNAGTHYPFPPSRLPLNGWRY